MVSRRFAEEPPTDRVLMDRIAVGDEVAFEVLYSRYRARVFAYVWRIIGDESADDLTQETFVRVWRARERFEATGSVVGYVVRIARRLALDELRRRQVRDRFKDASQHSTTALMASPEGELVREQLVREVDSAISALPERMREVFSLKRDAGLSYQEIGDQLGISVKTVEVHMSKALRRLRELLAGLNPANPAE